MHTVVGLIEADPHRVGARGRVRFGRHLADLAGVTFAAFGPELENQRAPRLERRVARLRHIDFDFQFAGLGQRQHRCPCRHNLADIGIDRGDDAVGIGLQARVSALVARHLRLCLCLLQSRLGGRTLIATRVKQCLADVVFIEQLPMPLQFRIGQAQICRCRRHRRSGRSDCQLRVVRCQRSQHVALGDTLPVVHTPRFNLSADAKTEHGLIARAHVTGIGFDGQRFERHRLRRNGRSHPLDRLVLARAPTERQRGD